MKTQFTEFQQILTKYYPYHQSRINFIAAYILALVKTATVNGTHLAVALNGKAQPSSNYRRIQRFFASFEFDFTDCARFVLSLLPVKSGYLLALDRTEWKFGSRWINIHTIGIVFGSMAFPVVWQVVPAKGNSNVLERVDLIKRLLKVIPPETIKALLADREFIGNEWLEYLNDKGIPFCIRIKQNARVQRGDRTIPVHRLFANLRPRTARSLAKPQFLYQQQLCLAGMKLHNEYCIVASNQTDFPILDLYKERWSIENLFSIFKSRGFYLEETHMTEPARIEKLIALLTIALVFVWKTGEYVSSLRPIIIKKHGRKAQSVFRAGLDQLRTALFHLYDSFQRRFLKLSFSFLSCT